MLLRDKFTQQLLYQLVKCAAWAELTHKAAQTQTSRCSGKLLSLCTLQELYQSIILPRLHLAMFPHEPGSALSHWGEHIPDSGQLVAKGYLVRQSILVCLAWEGWAHSGEGKVTAGLWLWAPAGSQGSGEQMERKKSSIALYWLFEGPLNTAAPTSETISRASSDLHCSALGCTSNSSIITCV